VSARSRVFQKGYVDGPVSKCPPRGRLAPASCESRCC